MDNLNNEQSAGMDRAGELPLERRTAERRASAPAVVAEMASTIVALKEQVSTLQAQLVNRNAALHAAPAGQRSDNFTAPLIIGVDYSGDYLAEVRAAARADVLEEVASVMAPVWGVGCADAIRALASQPAAPVQPDGSGKPTVHSRLMEISDIVRRDVRWTGNEYAFADLSESDVAMIDDLLGDALALNAAPPVQQPGDVREDAPANNLPNWSECAQRVENSDFIAKRVAEGGYGADAGSLLATELHRFIYEYDDADSYRSAWFMHHLELVIEEVKAQALATTRPSAALTDSHCHMIKEAAASIADLWAESREIDSTQEEVSGVFVRAILAASGGALAVPEGQAFSGKMVEIGTLEDGCGNGFVIEREYGFITVFGLSEAECRAMAKHWGDEVTLSAAPAIPAQGQTT